MSISDLNHFMTYVIEGWMLFSAGFISTTFVSFVSRRIQEDLEAAALAEGVTLGALPAAVTEEVNLSETVNITEAVEAVEVEPLELDQTEAARLEEVAAVSEQLAKNRGKQSDSSSVSVST